nr:MAG TPA: Transcription factor IIIA/RNA Complex finger, TRANSCRIPTION-RNA COMPLEX [Caudoviricetes sp.]
MAQGHVQIDGRSFARMVCGECGIEHYVPKAFDDNQVALGSKGGWRCPNGHSRVYRESEADVVRRERDLLKQRIAQKDDEIRRQREHREAAERSAAARKGQITRLKNRAAAGVCPCCNRSFENLRRHMDHKHPGFRAEEVA